MAARPASGGGRWVEVDPERLARWLDGFVERHAPIAWQVGDGGVVAIAADGERAQLYPAPGAGPVGGTDLAGQSPDTPPPAVLDFVEHSRMARRIGLLLVRRGGFGVGIALGADLLTSKVDSRYVQSRTAAGGWSQQRYARRRDNQVKALTADAAEVAARLLLPAADSLAALVTGGDRRLVDDVLADPRLGALCGLRAQRFLDVPDPRLTVLAEAARAARRVRVLITTGGGPERGRPQSPSSTPVTPRH